MIETTPPTADGAGHAAEALAHVMPLRVLLGVFAALLVLTATTVAVSYVDLGPVNLLVALGVATIKAALVAMYFMHLRHDSGLNAVIFLIGAAMLGLFLAVTMLDTIQYQHEVQSYEQDAR